jgi:hypothetical protein
MSRGQTIKRVAKRFRGRTRTSLYDWFWDNWDRLPEYRAYMVDWPGLTLELDVLGLKGRDDRPLSAGMVRMTYFRVKADKEAEAEAPVRQPAGPPPTPARQVTMREPPVRSSAAPQPAQKTTEGESDVSRRTTSAGFDHDSHASEDAIRRRFLGDKAD